MRGLFAILALVAGIEGVRVPARALAAARPAPRARGAATLALAALLAAAPATAAELTPSQRFATEAWRTTDALFYEREFGGLDWFGERGRLVKRATDDEAAVEGVRALLAKLGDKYTRYIPQEDYAKLVAATVGDAAFVAGAGVQVAEGAGGGAVLVDVEPGAPADAAGLRPGDRIVSVNGQRVDGPAAAASRFRGPTGSTAEVVYERGGAEASATVTRRVVELSTVRRDGGAVRIRSFALDTGAKVEAAVRDIDGAVVLDLRANGGGSLEGGVDTARLFLKKGARITTVVDKRGTPFTYDAVDDGPFVGRALSVLVDAKTASAAEVLTAALKDNGAGVVVSPDRATYGKGVIQTVAPLGDVPGSYGAVAVTVARYETPKGDDINGRGIAADRTVPSCGLAEKATACVAQR